MKRGWLCLALMLGSCGKDEGPRSNLTATEAASMRQACAFKAGATAGLTMAKDAPLGDQIPINTIVLLMMENRSFDHILGQLPKTGVTDVDVAADGVTNPDSSGNPIARFHNSSLCFADTNHEFAGSHQEFDNGKNDGFVIANENWSGGGPDGTRAMGWYDNTDVPWLYAAASSFAISDRHFASVMGPTYPNREYYYAGTSYGMTDNQIFSMGNKANMMTNIEAYNATVPTAQKITWNIYYDGAPGLGIFLDTLVKYLDHTNDDDQFFLDAAAGTLPNIVWLDPNMRDEFGGGDDDHPPGDPQVGDQFLAKVVKAVTTSPQWPHLALIITFDEHGGLYDHVPPPKGCAPDDLAPMVPAGQMQYSFAQYGFRVPLMVVSPYAKPHYVSHAITDHTSIIRFVEQRFKLPAMTARDANADPLSDMFDFGKSALLTPPSLPEAPVDATKLAACSSEFPLNPVNLSLDGGTPDDMGADMAH